MNDVFCGCSRLVTDGRRTKFSQRCSLPSVGVSLREESREWRAWLTVAVDVELVRRPLGTVNAVSLTVQRIMMRLDYLVEEYLSDKRSV